MIVDKVSGQESDIDFSGISKTGSADDERYKILFRVNTFDLDSVCFYPSSNKS